VYCTFRMQRSIIGCKQIPMLIKVVPTQSHALEAEIPIPFKSGIFTPRLHLVWNRSANTSRRTFEELAQQLASVKMAWLFIPLIAIGLYVTTTAWFLLRNYLRVRNSGFRIYLWPINPTSIPWLIFQGNISLRMAKQMPDFLWRRLRFCCFHASYLDRFMPWSALEPAVMLVSPGTNLLWIHEPGIGDSILARRKDFMVPDVTRGMCRGALEKDSLTMLLEGFSFYGPNVITVSGVGGPPYECTMLTRKIVGRGSLASLSEAIHKRDKRQDRKTDLARNIPPG
jgi:hypothetical protein